MWKNIEELRRLRPFLEGDTKAIEREVFPCPPNDEARRVMYALVTRKNYDQKWKWGPGQEYLFRALIKALGLNGMEESISGLFKSKRGRKEETDLAIRIWTLKADGKTVPQMKAIFESEGQFFSEERIKSYLKTRRRRAGHEFW